MPTWRDSAQHTGHFNRDVWGRLPDGMCWFRGCIEQQDIVQLYVIGSEDWQEEFGSYQLPKIADACLEPGNGYHQSRIRAMRQSLDEGWESGPLVLVASDGAGPFVMIDGNHRAAALQMQGELSGRECLVGFHRRLAEDFVWYWRALGLRAG